MAEDEQHDLIDGTLRPAALELGGCLEDPDTGSAWARQRASAPEALEAALASAQRAWQGGSGSWSGLEFEARASHLERFAVELEARSGAMAAADARDSGVPVAVTTAIAASLGSMVRSVLAAAREALAPHELAGGTRRVELLRLPFGPALLLAPWNAPGPTAVAKVAYALAAGCSAILKPSEHAPGAAAQLVRAALAAELPPGALQLVHGGPDVALRLAGDRRVRVVNLTGGQAAGRAVAAAAAPHMAALQLELGGTNPAVVADDADIEATAAALAAGMTKLNGQWCEAPRRILVAVTRHDELLETMLAELERIQIGPTWDPATELGPLAHRAQRDRVVSHLHALGGKAHRTEEVPATGFFFAPTVVTGADARGEIFGPVITLRAVVSDEDALVAANELGDGLAAYVFASRDRAFSIARRLHAGEVRINGTHLLDLAPGSAQSFWGSSGIGGHGARELLNAHTGLRVIGEDDPDLSI